MRFDLASRRREVAGVFCEFKNLRQEARSGRRRWFEADGLELVVWFEPDERVSGFQLCYDFGAGERALTWREGEGFQHSLVDVGEETPLKNLTPILQPDGAVPWAELVRRFEAHSPGLEAGLRELVAGRLADGAARQ